PAHVEAAEVRDFPAAIAGDIGSGNMHTDYISAFVMRTVTGPLENVGDAVYVAAQRAARNTKAIKVTFAGRGILRIVYGVVGNARRDGAGNDAVESTGPGNAAELKLFEQNRGSLVEGGDVGAGKVIGQGNASEGAFLKRIACEGGE